MMGDDLPAPVAGYFRRAVKQDPPTPRGTRLRQAGEMRLAPDKPWSPLTAVQHIEARRTGFVWRARVRMAPLVTAHVVDAYEDGQGRLVAKLWGLFPVARASGAEADRSEAQRYLAELPWCPMALVHNPELRFAERSDREVRVWVHDEDTYMDLRFDGDGDLVGARTETRTRGPGLAQPWEGRFWDFRDFGSIRAPSRGKVWWETPEGPFEYWRGRLTSFEPLDD